MFWPFDVWMKMGVIAVQKQNICKRILSVKSGASVILSTSSCTVIWNYSSWCEFSSAAVLHLQLETVQIRKDRTLAEDQTGKGLIFWKLMLSHAAGIRVGRGGHSGKSEYKVRDCAERRQCAFFAEKAFSPERKKIIWIFYKFFGVFKSEIFPPSHLGKSEIFHFPRGFTSHHRFLLGETGSRSPVEKPVRHTHRRRDFRWKTSLRKEFQAIPITETYPVTAEVLHDTLESGVSPDRHRQVGYRLREFRLECNTCKRIPVQIIFIERTTH